MAIQRVTDAQTYALLTERAGKLQATLDTLQEEIATGRKLLTPDQDPLGAAQVVRHTSDLAALAQYSASSRFGSDVLGAEDQVLGDATNLLVRAEEIATQQASNLNAPERLAAAEEVHGLLQSLTVAGNSELAGRRLFGALALDAPPSFADPDTPGYDAATAYSGPSGDFSVKIGASAGERVRLTTRGDTVFGGALGALQALETALRTNGDVAGTLAALGQGRDTIIAERASVGAREAQLQERDTQVSGLTNDNQATLAHLRDADLVSTITQLTQAQQALETVLASGARIVQTSLLDYVRL